MRVATTLFLICVAAPGVAWAQGGASVDAVTACRTITEDRARLQCYDKAAATLDTARRQDGLVVLNRTEIREKKRSLFGLKLPQGNLFGTGKDDNKEDEKTRVDEIDTSVAAVQPSGRGRWTLRFADGSVWRTTETARIDPERGNTVKVKRAALGSYRASFDGNYPVRIERVE